MPFNIKKKAAKLGKAIKNKVSRTRDDIQDAVAEMLATDPYDLDETQMTVADAILASGAGCWQYVTLRGTALRYIRLNPREDRIWAPFGALDSCAIEILSDRVRNVGKERSCRELISASVDHYVQIDPYDLVMYLREQETDTGYMYFMNTIPVGRAMATADVLFGDAQFLENIQVHPTSRNNNWVHSVITASSSINVMSRTRRNSAGVTIRSTNTGDIARANQRQNIVHSNPAYTGRPTRRRRSISGDNPLYE